MRYVLIICVLSLAGCTRVVLDSPITTESGAAFMSARGLADERESRSEQQINEEDTSTRADSVISQSWGQEPIGPAPAVDGNADVGPVVDA